MKAPLHTNNEKKEYSLKIVAKEQKPLSKNQQMFNRLTKRIELLKFDITQESDKLNMLLDLYGREVIPLHDSIANSRIALAMVLGKATDQTKFTKKQLQEIGDAIVELCREAFKSIDPSDEQVAFYDLWSKTTYKEELEQQMNMAKEMFSDMMSDVYGMNIDLDDVEDTPEGFARFQQKMREQQQQEQQDRKKTTRPKTKKQQAKEEAQKAEEAIKNRSIRSIYIALAKVLHPDGESDIDLKAEKEEIMKRVTVAYDQQDLPTLLKLEMEWVHKTSEHLEQLTEDKLKLYLSVLKQQVTELENEKLSIIHSPRYEAVTAYACMPTKIALSRIRKTKKELVNICSNLADFSSRFEKPNAKREVIEFAISYKVLMEEKEEMEAFWNEMMY